MPQNHQNATPNSKPNPKFLSILLQALIMSFIISLFFIFIGVAAIIFIHLCIAGGALHRRRNRRRPISGSAKIPSGFSLELLSLLPKSRYKGDVVCAICLENVENVGNGENGGKGEFSRVLPGCNHVFHMNCVDLWLMKVPACPTCRTSVRVSGRDVEEVDKAAGFDWERLWGSCG